MKHRSQQRFLAVALAILALSACPVGALAKTSETSSDLHCMMVGIQLLGAKDAKEESAGRVIAMYFLGRLDGGAPGVDLEKRFHAELGKFKPSKSLKVVKSCAALTASREKALVEMIKDFARNN